MLFHIRDHCVVVALGIDEEELDVAYETVSPYIRICSNFPISIWPTYHPFLKKINSYFKLRHKQSCGGRCVCSEVRARYENSRSSGHFIVACLVVDKPKWRGGVSLRQKCKFVGNQMLP